MTTLEVIDEMDQSRSPDKLRRWIVNLPDWLELQQPNSQLRSVARLGRGEATAISLARELDADVILIDERDGTRVARAEGLFVTGTLGVLTTASRRGLIVLRVALEALAKTNYRYSPAMFDKLIRDDELRA